MGEPRSKTEKNEGRGSAAYSGGCVAVAIHYVALFQETYSIHRWRIHTPIGKGKHQDIRRHSGGGISSATSNPRKTKDITGSIFSIRI